MIGLHDFILEAKATTYVGEGRRSPGCRTASHDIRYDSGPWSYLDSYFGRTDFLGQEVVWRNYEPLWAMNYYGRILAPELIDGSMTGTVVKEALSTLYKLGRFLGGFDYIFGPYRYVDRSDGSVEEFSGTERIYVQDREVYRLDYHGGSIKP